MALDPSDTPPCYDAAGRCLNDRNGDGDCEICMSDYWVLKRRSARPSGVSVNVDVDLFGEMDW